VVLFQESVLGIQLPNPITVDLLLLGFCRIVLNIPCPTLYAAASRAGQVVATGLDAVLTTGFPPPPLIDVSLNLATKTANTYWGNKYFGPCYDTWATKCQLANNLHYLYTGPDVNPDGLNSTNGYCLSTPPLFCQSWN